MFERWAHRARADVERHGLLAAGFRLACTIALVAIAAAGPVWLRDYLRSGLLPMLPVLGNASALTFAFATVGFPAAAVLWILGLGRAARVAGGAALLGWLLTAVVFQLLMGGTIPLVERVGPDQAALPAWTLLAVLAAIAVRQERPRATATVAGGLLVAAVGAFALTASGLLPDGSTSYLVAAESAVWRPAVLDRGLNTLHTAVLTGWALVLIVGAAAWRIDRRPLAAAAWLAPFVALSQLTSLSALVAAAALAVAVGVPAFGHARDDGRVAT